MSRIAFLLVFLCSAYTSLAQYSISGTVVDHTSKTSLMYVNVGILNSDKGTVTDENGLYHCECVKGKDVVVFSYVGYDVKTIPCDSLAVADTIRLEPAAYALEQVTIRANKLSKKVILGARHKKGRGQSIGMGNPQLGSEIGARIRIKKETYLKSINFVLNHAKGDSLLMRVNIYSYGEGRVGEKLLLENVFIKEKQRRGVFSVDMQPYHLILDEDVLISLEWLKDYDEAGSKNITFDTKSSRKLGGTYIRFSKTDQFRRVPVTGNRKPCIYIEGRQ